MGLPMAIEYLTTQEREGPDGRPGGPLFQSGANQTIVTIPPLRQVVINALPTIGDYANIIYHWAFDPQMMPNAFYAYGMYTGVKTYEGVASAWWLNNTIDGYIIVSGNRPAQALIRNLTNLNQYYQGIVIYLSIRSEDDWKEVQKRLLLLTQGENEKIAIEALGVLKRMESVNLAAAGPRLPLER